MRIQRLVYSIHTGRKLPTEGPETGSGTATSLKVESGSGKNYSGSTILLNRHVEHGMRSFLLTRTHSSITSYAQ
jgi:hypothetical protein